VPAFSFDQGVKRGQAGLRELLLAMLSSFGGGSGLLAVQ